MTFARRVMQVLARDVAYELIPLMQRRNLHARLAETLAAAASAVGPMRPAVAPADLAVGPMRPAMAAAASAVGPMRPAAAVASAASAASAVGPMHPAVAPVVTTVPAATVAYHWSQSCSLSDGRSLDSMELPRVLKVGCCNLLFCPLSPTLLCPQVFISLFYLHCFLHFLIQKRNGCIWNTHGRGANGGHHALARFTTGCTQYILIYSITE